MKKILSLFLTINFTSIEIAASQSGSAHSKMDRENYVLTHSAYEILPFPARNAWKHATQKVISNRRLQKINTLKAKLVKERAKTFKLEGILDGMTQSSRSIIGTLQNECAAKHDSLRLARVKYDAFKASTRQQYFDLVEQRDHLIAMLQKQEADADAMQAEMGANAKRMHAELISIATLAEDRQATVIQLNSAEQQLRTQIDALQAARDAAAQQHQIALNELNAARADLQALQTQLTTVQAAKTNSEQQLNDQLSTERSVHAATLAQKTTAVNDLNGVRVQSQTLQAQLTAAQAAHATATQNHQAVSAQLNATEQQLRAQIGALQTARDAAAQQYQTASADLGTMRTNLQAVQAQLTAVQAAKANSEQQLNGQLTTERTNAQAAQNQLAQERTARAASEQVLRAQLAATQAANANATQNHQAVVAQLNVLKAHQAQFEALKKHFRAHFDNVYNRYHGSLPCIRTDHVGALQDLYAVRLLHCILAGLPVGTKVENGQVGSSPCYFSPANDLLLFKQ